MKANILSVGTVVMNPLDGTHLIENWGMDATNKNVPIVEVLPDGSQLFCGYSVDELKAISMPYVLTHSQDFISIN